MGRHSAADDGKDEGLSVASVTSRPSPFARHSRTEDDESAPAADDVGPEDLETERIGLIELAMASEADAEAEADAAAATAPLPAVSAPAPASGRPADDTAGPQEAGEPAEPEPGRRLHLPHRPARPAGGAQSTAADLALLRTRPDVRARCIAAVVVPFVLYTAVLFLIGAVDVYLIWVWIPLVTAGVVAGSILDIEHRRQVGSADPPPGQNAATGSDSARG